MTNVKQILQFYNTNHLRRCEDWEVYKLNKKARSESVWDIRLVSCGERYTTFVSEILQEFNTINVYLENVFSYVFSFVLLATII